MNRSDYNVGLVLIAIGIFIYISSYYIPVLTIIEKTGMVNSRFFPKICGIFLVFFSIVMILENYMLMCKKEKTMMEEVEKKEKIKYIRIVVVAALSFLYLITYQYLGHLVSSFLFICMFMYFLGIRNLFLLISAPAGISFLIYAVFKIFLNVPLPQGIVIF